VSNARDLAVFFGALLRGRLVAAHLLAKMETIVPDSHGEGMGLYRLSNPCGVPLYWAHGWHSGLTSRSRPAPATGRRLLRRSTGAACEHRGHRRDGRVPGPALPLAPWGTPTAT
jgi:hypothetical protein